MRLLIALLLATCSITAQPLKTNLWELGVLFPLAQNNIRDFVSKNNVATIPLTSGIGSGFHIGRHQLVSRQASVGTIAGFNMFYANTGTGASQIYQLESLIVGRLYFGESWREGVYAELGSGLEFSIASFPAIPTMYQINVATRLAVGYNYAFNSEVTIGAAIRTVPSVSNFIDGTKIVVNMMW